MLTFFDWLGLAPWQFGLIALAGFLIGFSKTGIGGIMMIAVPVLATAFGGRVSTGIILPMLIIADLFAIGYYHRHADWPGIRRLLPWAVGGLFTGILVGNLINDRQFTLLIAVSVLICLAVLIVLETRKGKLHVPDNLAFYALIGFSAGFTTMIGNVAGPIFSVFLLARRYDKIGILGTSAWFFAIINWIKLPLQIFFWENITLHTALIDAMMIPAIVAGAVVGAIVVKRIPEKPFRWLIVAATAIACIRLFFP
ncbi:MAG: sulfite exporter TauE/SafE family protein [Propionivibrio sp.]